MDYIFSKSFVQNIFNKRPAELLNNDFEVNENDIFKSLFMYRNNLTEILSKNIAADFITAINGSLTPEVKWDMLVSEEDKNLDKYIDRLDKELEGNDWCIAYFGATYC